MEAFKPLRLKDKLLPVISMRDALKSFHKNILTEDYEAYKEYFGVPPTDFFYEAFSWQSFKQANVQAYTSLSDKYKKRIEAEEQKFKLLSKHCPQ